jgi:hypothetical protein
LNAGATGGLSGMHERVALLGGQLAIESASEGGTCLTAEFPLAASPAAPALPETDLAEPPSGPEVRKGETLYDDDNHVSR